MASPHMCDPGLLETDLSGRRFVVTGANSGIGWEVTRQLARQGAQVVLACRRREEGERRVAELSAEHPGARVEVGTLDLGDLASIRSFASGLRERSEALHGLINNAGVMNTPRGTTRDGFETQFGINHLGHFLLTEELLPLLRAGAPSRIVNVSSCFHDKAMGREGTIDLEDPNFEQRPYDGWSAYAQSKLANVLHARELARRLEGSAVTVVSVHPGWVRTNLIRNSLPVWLQDTLLRPALRLAGMIEPWEGAQTTLFAALDPSVVEHSGSFYSQLGTYRDKAANRGGWPMRSPNPLAEDDELASALWALSEQLVGPSSEATAGA